MAANTQRGSKGSMDIADNRRTWRGFLKVTGYSVGSALLILLFLAIFRTHS